MDFCAKKQMRNCALSTQLHVEQCTCAQVYCTTCIKHVIIAYLKIPVLHQEPIKGGRHATVHVPTRFVSCVSSLVNCSFYYPVLVP